MEISASIEITKYIQLSNGERISWSKELELFCA